MRFRSEFIGAIRRGEKTQQRRPVQLDRERHVKPCPYVPGHAYVLERVWDERREDGDTIYYDLRREAIPGEAVRVTQTRTEPLIDISDDDVSAEGFESREDFLDYFTADWPDCERVWVIAFEWTTDVDRFMASQHDILHGSAQYVTSPVRAIDDLPAVGADWLSSFAAKADDDLRQRQEIARLERRRDELAQRIEYLKRRAA